MRKSKIKNQNFCRGFTLLETLAALSVLTFAMVGPVTLTVYSIRSASFSQNQITAFYLAQEAMEYVRNRRDSNALQNQGNWLEGLINCRNANGCYVDPTRPDSDSQSIVNCPSAGCPKLRRNNASGIYSYNVSDPETIFSRKIKFTQVSSYEEKVEITLFWQDKGGV